jgi:predicted O-methyltransferase YrrM
VAPSSFANESSDDVETPRVRADIRAPGRQRLVYRRIAQRPPETPSKPLTNYLQMINKSATLRAIREVIRLRVLPPHVAGFQWRARRRARQLGDAFALESSTRPADLARLLKIARGRNRVVELGTANGWTAIALALDAPQRHVGTFDPFDRPERRAYLELVAPRVRERITFVPEAGRTGPGAGDPSGRDLLGGIELLYIDSSHEREETIAEVRAWEGALAPGALIVFDDYGHPAYPGVRAAVDELGLRGRLVGTLYVVTAGVASSRSAGA